MDLANGQIHVQLACLDIIYYLISGLSYDSGNFLTRIIIIRLIIIIIIIRRRRTICDFATCHYHTFALSLVHAGGPATFVITRESQICIQKG